MEVETRFRTLLPELKLNFLKLQVEFPCHLALNLHLFFTVHSITVTRDLRKDACGRRTGCEGQ